MPKYLVLLFIILTVAHVETPDRAPKGNKNIRILQTMVSVILLGLGLGTRIEDHHVCAGVSTNRGGGSQNKLPTYYNIWMGAPKPLSSQLYLYLYPYTHIPDIHRSVTVSTCVYVVCRPLPELSPQTSASRPASRRGLRPRPGRPVQIP